MADYLPSLNERRLKRDIRWKVQTPRGFVFVWGPSREWAEDFIGSGLGGPPTSLRRFPDATPSPCNECPWRRVARPGHLGPHTPLDWIRIAHGEGAIACHKTVVVTDPLEGSGNWSHPKLRQCRGAAIFRANVGKLPKNLTIETGPINGETCFDSNEEFLEHHGGDVGDARDIYGPLSTGD